ncbi:MAG TPA: hypothetical protein VLE96_00685 [Chlamydiales bacterium]|nr:hypothetical protein [Chlamydiales bacterium]
MKPKKRQKLCHNCEGEIDLDVIVCPFCAADLREEKPEQKYSTCYVTQRQAQPVQPLYPNQEEVANAVQAEEKPVNPIYPMIFFTIGIQLCVFSLLMLFFSQGGEVILKWDARFWFFYLFASVPFLVLGGKYLSKMNE